MINRVTVSTSARLHLGFFDLSSQTNRRFGSMGVAIQAYRTSLSLSKSSSASDNHRVDQDKWASAIFQRHLAQYSHPSPMQLDIQSSIPRHSGLGSGTQMALAMGCAVDHLLETPFDAKKVALHHQRGGRSGIGIYTFEQGGLIVDGGHASNSAGVPPKLGRYVFPEDWPFILIEDTSHVGIHGDQEKQAFKTLKPQSLAATHQLSHRILMETLPALIERNYAVFASGLGALQQYNASYFSEAQGGMFASEYVSKVLAYLNDLGYQGLGQSSWGPTGFVLLPSLVEAETCLKALERTFAETPLRFTLTHACNQGADIQFA
jgi:beta-ribofuranosylaminobenzene 5'-phosphate synthase